MRPCKVLGWNWGRQGDMTQQQKARVGICEDICVAGLCGCLSVSSTLQKEHLSFNPGRRWERMLSISSCLHWFISLPANALRNPLQYSWSAEFPKKVQGLSDTLWNSILNRRLWCIELPVCVFCMIMISQSFPIGCFSSWFTRLSYCFRGPSSLIQGLSG